MSNITDGLSDRELAMPGETPPEAGETIQWGRGSWDLSGGDPDPGEPATDTERLEARVAGQFIINAWSDGGCDVLGPCAACGYIASTGDVTITLAADSLRGEHSMTRPRAYMVELRDALDVLLRANGEAQP